MKDQILDILPFGVAGLCVLCVSGLIWAALAKRAATIEMKQRRFHAIAPAAAGPDQVRTAEQEARRSARINKERKRQTRNVGLRSHFVVAGLDWSLGKIVCAYLVIVAPIAIVILAMGGSPLISLALGVATAPGVVFITLKVLRQRRLSAMEKDFPGAIDIIVRGVKSGLPLNDCLGVVSREVGEPLRSEFAQMVERQRHGTPAAEAVARFARRVPLSEASFFAIVLALQTKTGGRLAESLDNLVNVLRARTQLRAKIKSMSSEAKASGGIIAALPPVVSVLVYFTSPDYIGILFDETAGNIVLVGSAIWMLVGVAVMRKMIAFDH